jgi:hypothetical protein
MLVAGARFTNIDFPAAGFFVAKPMRIFKAD